MSQYYNPKRTKFLYDPASVAPFKISRSKIDLFLECPLCFYLDRRRGVGRPPGFPFSLNSAVDKLLKKEFDLYRARQKPHPLMKHYGVAAHPFAHKDLDKWRENFVGVQYRHAPTNFIVTGAVDDVWVNDKKELIVVDYKATSKDGEVNIDADWQIGYKRQMEVYQWLLRNNGHDVSSTGYFVYCNGNTDKKSFDAKIEFDIKLIPYTGNDDWVERTLMNAHACLRADMAPASALDCDYCQYRNAVAKAL